MSNQDQLAAVVRAQMREGYVYGEGTLRAMGLDPDDFRGEPGLVSEAQIRDVVSEAAGPSTGFSVHECSLCRHRDGKS